MAKKKRRYERRKGKRNNNRARWKDNHHLLWQERYWRHGKANILRSHPYCQIRIPIGLHHYIHDHMTTVPVPCEKVIDEVISDLAAWELDGLISLSDDIEQRLAVLIVLFSNRDKIIMTALRRQYNLIHKF